MKQINILFNEYSERMDVTNGRDPFEERGRSYNLGLAEVLKVLRGHDKRRAVEVRVSVEMPEELRPELERGISNHFKRAEVSYAAFEIPKYKGKKEGRG